MHPLNNGSQVTTKPAEKPRIGTPGYFAESNESGAPSSPGQDWFNAVIREFQTAATDGGITFDPDRFDHLSRFIQALGKGAVYDELVGFVLPDSTIQTVRDRAFLADGAEYNRADYPKLWNKINGTGILLSQALIDADPETHAANYGDGDGVNIFTVPNYSLRPHLAVAGMFGGVGTTVENQIQNVTGRFGDTGGIDQARSAEFRISSGVFRAVEVPRNIANTLGTSYTTKQDARFLIDFDLSLSARTGDYTEVNSSFLSFYIIHGESA